MHKLTNVESQRMMAVMGDLLDRLNYLTYVPLDPQAELLATFRENRCINTAELMREHWRWEKLYLQAVEALDSRQDDIADQVRVTARTLCRDLRENPVSVEILYQDGTASHDRSEDMQTLVKTLSELTDLTHSQLEKTLEDAKSRKELMNIAETRMKQAEDERVAIREKLSELRKTKEEEIALLDAQVQKLRSELNTINQTAAHELNMIEAELKEAQSKAHENHTQEMKMLLDKAAMLQVQADKMALEHREEEDLLRKKKCKTAAEVASIVEKYDSEMVAMENEIRQLELSFEAEREQCQQLNEHFMKIDEEQTRIDSEERVLDEIRAREREKQMFIYRAATNIQRIYRGVLCRREYAKMLAKTKKGKKGAKGKKGKNLKMTSRFEVLEEETHYPDTHPLSKDNAAATGNSGNEHEGADASAAAVAAAAGEEPQKEETLEERLAKLVLVGDDKGVKKASEAKEIGNKFFGQGRYLDAIECYTTALKLCPVEEDLAYNRAVYFNNRGACLLKLGRAEEAVDDCSQAIDLSPKYVKALTRRAEAYEKLDRLEEALKDYDAVLAIDPTIQPVVKAQRRVKAVVDERHEKMKAEMMDKLKGFGNTILGKFGLSTDNFQMVQDPSTGSYNINFTQNPQQQRK
ncbi:TPA: hypothetical protein N0F65_001022 [Lagenidium giganteum]|uniref:Dynein regulatory complex protein 10 n=1 Tax=Lagenidium giganteum TaxID=4803 RepID=A0AAV2YZK7_9STRA|nr:TPA: hypothetical protein N0F65_001022 [Lagenidium giganteum]